MTVRESAAPTPARKSSPRFREIERRIEATRKRIPGYPFEQATLVRLIIQIERRQNDLCNLVLKAFDLNFVEYNTLMVIHVSESGAVTASDISNATGEKPANVTRLCDALLGRKLINRSRHTTDRRSVVLQLTRKAELLIADLHPPLWDALCRVYGSLDPDETRLLASLLRRPLAVLES